MLSGKPVMQPEEFRLLKEFVMESFGLVLEEGKGRFLALKLLARLEELRLHSFYEYYGYLKFAPRCTEERQRLISLITNNETYFFREEPQLRVFVDEILPQLKREKQARGERTIRIVSAGCSSGEEVYTLAMLFLQAASFPGDWDLRITGIDVDPCVLERARAGIYSPRSFRSATPQYLERYFKISGHDFLAKDLLRNCTRFVEGNLLDLTSVIPERNIDVIFCRNVLIYFSDETSKRVVRGFSELLAPQGLLFLGHSESLSRISTHYLPLRFPGAILYKKKD